MIFELRVHFFLTLILIFLIQANVLAQETVSINGSIKIKADLSPVAGAQVFLNGSTIGTLSDAEGNFSLTGVPKGIHEFVIQSLGFESVRKTINTDSLESNYSFFLTEKVYELDEITIKPNTNNWEYNFEVFKRIFIGQGPFSENTEIKNEEIINFDFNTDDRILYAFAYDRIEIINEDLGYKIYFYLEDFQVDFKTDITFFFGQTFFEEMSSRRNRTINKWTKNRKKAYLGSFAHFTRSLIDQKTLEAGFLVKAEQRKDDTRYISRDTVSQLLYFDQVDSSFYEFQFKNYLNVTYVNEYEDMSYLNSIASPLDSNPRLSPEFQKSAMTLLADSVLLDRTGFILNPTSILFEGYWGFEKISDMLPIDYKLSD
jgi:hypothetical protein